MGHQAGPMQRGGGRSACDLERTRFASSLDPPKMGGFHGRSMADPLNCVAYSQPEPEQLPQKSHSIIASLHTPHGPPKSTQTSHGTSRSKTYSYLGYLESGKGRPD